MLDDGEAREAAAYYVIKNCWNAQRGYADRAEPEAAGKRKPKTPAERQAVKATLAKAVEELDKKLTHIYRLDMLMPNGKKLRHCNAKDLRGFDADNYKLADAIGDGDVGDRFATDEALGSFANH